MPNVRIAVSGLQRDIDIVWPLMDDIAEAFAPFGVTLTPERGTVVAEDPRTLPNGWDNLIDQLHSTSQNSAPAHLVATDIAPGSDPTINGTLCDPQIRGICAVFMNAQIYMPNGPSQSPDLVTQVCVHELGHLLNLTHDDAAYGGYANAMQPGYLRQNQDLADAWQAAVDDAASRSEPLLVRPTPPLGYPFNAQCRANLRQASIDPRWLPYGSRFRGTDLGAGSVDDRSLMLTVEPHPDEPVHVGGELYFTVTIENRGDLPIDLPLHLTPEHGALRIVVTPDGGSPAAYHPTEVHCSCARQTLAPGHRIFSSVAVAGPSAGALVRAPGFHGCHVELLDGHGAGRRQVGAAAFYFIAEANPDRWALSLRLRRMLTPGTPRLVGLPDVWAVKEDSAVAAHLRLAEALRGGSGLAHTGLLQSCVPLSAPRALRHTAAHCAASQRLADGADRGRVEDDIAHQFQDPEDTPLIHAVARSADGWAHHRSGRSAP